MCTGRAHVATSRPWGLAPGKTVVTLALTGLQEEARIPCQLDGHWALAAESTGHREAADTCRAAWRPHPYPRVILCVSSHRAWSRGPTAIMAGLARPMPPTPTEGAVGME